MLRGTRHAIAIAPCTTFTPSTTFATLAMFAMFALFTLFAMLAAPRAEAVTFGDVRGSLGVGYSKLYGSEAPGGSIATSAHLSLPVRGAWSAGLGLGLHLLGSRTVPRGSLIASVDYSLFEVGAFAHWAPARLGPVSRVSAGVEFMSAHAELSTSGGGALFRDLAVEKTAPGAALDVTLMPRRASPVRIGLQLGGRWAMLSGDDWTVFSSQLVFHY